MMRRLGMPFDSLRQRCSDEVFQLAAAYCSSGIPKHRARALDVLAQLGAGKPLSERPHFSESVALALAHIGDEDPGVVRSAAWALAHLNDDRAVTALVGIRKHDDPDVRWAVAVGMANSAAAAAISTLMELMEDPNDEVRNWSTFELGNAYFNDGSNRLAILDSDEIREAFRRRLNDRFGEVRDEAIWALARRADRAGLQHLLKRLKSEHIGGDEMAAADTLERNHDTHIEESRQGLQNLLDAL